MTITVSMLRAFSAVAQCGNLADAGTQLGRTQSALSMTLKQLEENLGARLFESERKSRLTPLGEEIFELAQQQLRQFDETIGAIKTVAGTPQGLIRIASVPSVVYQGLPLAVDRFLERHRTIQIDIRDTDTDIVIAALLRGQADIGIVSGTPSLNGLRQHLLFEDRFGLVGARHHPLIQRAEPPRFEDLTPDCFVRNNLCALIATQEFRKPLADARVTARNTLSLISMVRTDRWVTVLPSTVVGIFPGHLAFREIEGLTEKRPVSLLVRERSLFPDLVNELADILREQSWHPAEANGVA